MLWGVLLWEVAMGGAIPKLPKTGNCTELPKTPKAERYILKFSKGGKAKLHDDDLGLLTGAPEDGEAYYVQAGHVEEEELEAGES